MKKSTCLSVSAALLGACILSAPPAFAVHDLEDLFELENFTDGADAIDDSTSPEDDWGTTDPTICGPSLASCGYVSGPNAPGGHSLVDIFLNDVPPAGGTDNVFTGGGSKDDLDISGWKWTTKAGVTDKDDIRQAGAAAYSEDGDTVVYFFQTLYAPNGDAAAGLWLFQDRISPMVNAQGVGQFMEVDGAGNPVGVASHKVGDIFVSAKLSNGGRNVTMVVYKWVGQNNAADCPGGAAALAPPKNSLCIIKTEADANCGTVGPAHTACGTMNLRPSESPDDWGFMAKSPPAPGAAWPPGTNGIQADDFPATTFLEGGVNLGELGLTGCFSTFLMETRSSDSVRAVLKDFTIGDFPLCGLEVTKVCAPLDPAGGPNPAINDDGVSINTTFGIQIANTGISTVYDVTLEEDKSFDPDESCWIHSVDGDTSWDGTPLDTDTPVEIAAVLLSTDPPIDVVIQCDTYDNPFVNRVTARAKTSELLTEPDLNDTDELVDDPSVPREAGGACPAVPSGALFADKNCQSNPTTLVLDAEGRLQVQVNVDFHVRNDGDEKLLNITLLDDKIGAINVGDLLPGGEVHIQQSYIADQPDGAGPTWNPFEAEFTDTMHVTNSEGAISGMQVLPTVNTFSATCKLCDCADCPN